MFRDPDVRLILAAIGGDHCCHLLPLLDFDLIRENPTLFMGFSDITVLNVAIWQQTGLVTFNGPALLTDFAEYPEMFDYTRDYFLKAVGGSVPIGPIVPSPWWTEEFLDWQEQADRTRPRHHRPSGGWTWLKPGVAEGELVGGCLESLEHLRGTRFWPEWSGRILFIETSEMAPSPAAIDGMLMDYENMGVFASIRALLVGRPMKYTQEQRTELRAIVLERTKAFDFPVVTDMDFGHTAPQFTLPIGCLARIDTASETFEILEPAVSPRVHSA
jgi:muramoyltetrapeptide carboxypeptidase LdcA involved in peptidoglycan recycling